MMLETVLSIVSIGIAFISILFTIISIIITMVSTIITIIAIIITIQLSKKDSENIHQKSNRTRQG